MDISALFGSTNAFADIIAARQQANASKVTGVQTADSVKTAISNATRLDDTAKDNLTKLTDTVSEFANNDPKLLRDIAGLTNLLQIGQKEQAFASSPFNQLLSASYARKTGNMVDLLA